MPKSTPTPRAQEMRRHLKDLNESGLSVREYCELSGITKSAVYWWRRRLRDDVPETKPATEFVAVTVVPDRAPPESLIVELVGGRRVAIPSRFDEASLRR